MADREQWDIVSSVGLTALIVPAGRPVDTHRADGLIQDPWAERFILAANPPTALPIRPVEPLDDSEDEAWQMMSGYMGVRTRFFDEYFGDATAAGVRQIVILAAGLDTRAQRLVWPAGTTVYEIDQPSVLAFKHRVLAQHGATTICRRRTVSADLRTDWAGALLAAGFDPARPTAWLAEGLLPYLPAAAQDRLLSSVTELSALGSTVAVEDFTNLTYQVHDPTFRRISERLGVDMSALLHDDDREDAGAWLAARGWQISSDLADEIAAEYGRTLDPLTVRLNGKSLFQTAIR